MKMLFILNEAPYGSEKTYNALRLAMAIQKEHGDCQVRIFLMADAVNCALTNQKTPDGYYNIERMLKSVIHKGGEVQLCGTCCDARGIRSLTLVEGCDIGTMSLLAQWTVESDKVLTL
jgi:uncharacterized protein involved in oxidation of intracellular sulfur